MIPWSSLQAGGRLGPLDRHLGETLARLAPHDAPWVGLAAAVVSRALDGGHTAVALADLVPPVPAEGDPPPLGFPWPESEAFSAALAASPLVSDDPDRTPIVLRDGRVALARYAHAEQRVAVALARLAVTPAAGAVDAERLDALVATVFRGLSSSPDQEAAVRDAAARTLVVLAGGPGSGKTSTVVRILAAIVDQALARRDPVPRVLLLAPTGKAAARVGESIRDQLGALGLDAPVLRALGEALRTPATTIHRALGAASDWTTRVRHDAERPWAHDVIVVDEASMIDTPLLARLLDAVKPGARLVLLGDPYQLPAVGVGAALADLCGQGASGEPPAPVAATVRTLRSSHRFGPDTPIGRLARAVRGGDPAEVEAALGPGASWEEAPPRPDRAFLERCVEGWRPFAEARDREGRLAALDRFRVLCATRVGPWGVEALVPAIEAALARAGLLRRERDDPWYDGRPVLVTANDPSTRLSNGDVGVVERRGDRAVVVFPDLDPETGARVPREVLPTRLPAHETVYAMTVHKSQGSQFERVLLVLPPPSARVLTNELLYTAVTRAAGSVHLVGPKASLLGALPRRARRGSGLVGALRRAVEALAAEAAAGDTEGS